MFTATSKPYLTAFCKMSTGTVQVTFASAAPVVIVGTILPAELGVNLAERMENSPLEDVLPDLASVKRLFGAWHRVR